MEKSENRGSSPIATVEEIHRRLLRPSSLHSQSSTSILKSRNDLVTCDSSLFNANSSESQRIKESKKRLEDYLDPVLLSAIRNKIGGKKRKRDGGEMNKLVKSSEFEFDWRADELKVFTTESLNDAVDLNNDLDSIEGVGEDDDEVFCTPFQRFERTALKRFRR